MSSLLTIETWNSGFLQLPHSNAHSLGRPSANLSAQRGEHEGEQRALRCHERRQLTVRRPSSQKAREGAGLLGKGTGQLH